MLSPHCFSNREWFFCRQESEGRVRSVAEFGKGKRQKRLYGWKDIDLVIGGEQDADTTAG